MIRQLKQAFSILVLASLAQSAMSADTITGEFDQLVRSQDLIIVDGQRIVANMESTRISFKGEIVGEESLETGDEVTLIFSENRESGGKPSLLHIILVDSKKSGLDS